MKSYVLPTSKEKVRKTTKHILSKRCKNTKSRFPNMQNQGRIPSQQQILISSI